MASATRTGRTTPRRLSGRLARMLEALDASAQSGRAQMTTLASAALFAWRETSTEAIEALLEGGLASGLRWLQMLM